MSYSYQNMLLSIVKRYLKDIIRIYFVYKNLGEVLDKLKARDFNTTSLSTYDFSTLYTNLHLIERTFNREGSSYLAFNKRNAFCILEKPKNIMHGLVKMYVMC